MLFFCLHRVCGGGHVDSTQPARLGWVFSMCVVRLWGLSMKIISIFDRSGVMVRPWHRAGHEVLTLDIEPALHDMPSIQADIRKVPVINADIVFAFVPCTEFSRAGARWWAMKDKHKPHLLREARELLAVGWDWCAPARYWMIENPVGRLNQVWRYPDWKFDPWEFAGYLEDPTPDRRPKRTNIWSNWNKPPMEPRLPLPENKGWTTSRANAWQRSITPAGFAEAVFQHLS